MKLKQGTRITYNIDNSLQGEGEIVGVANNGVPILGIMYIIEPDIPIKNEVYDYSHICVYEYYLKVVKEEGIITVGLKSIKIDDIKDSDELIFLSVMKDVLIPLDGDIVYKDSKDNTIFTYNNRDYITCHSYSAYQNLFLIPEDRRYKF